MMKRKIAMMLLAFAIFLPCVFALSACSDKPEDNAKVTSISVEFNSVEYELVDNTVTIPYGDKLEFDNQDFKVIAHLDNGKNEEVSFNTESISGYTLASTLPTDCDITPRGEYTVTFSYLEFEIVVNVNVIKATIDMSEVEWDYTSAFTYDGNLKQINLINVPQGVTINYSGNSATDAGEYTAIATFTYEDSENYNPIDNMELDWEINPATYIVDEDDITINSYDFTYDSNNKSVVLNTDGLDANVEIANVTGLTAKDAGEHIINITFDYVGQSTNYDSVTPIQLSWIIKQANLTITANDAVITYGDEAVNAKVGYTGFVADEDESVLTGTLSYQYVDYVVGSPVGNYDIIPSGLISTNYNIEYVNGKLIVNKASLVIKANDQTISYNQPASNNGITPTGFVAGDTLDDLDGELVYSYNYEVGNNVDEYEISVSGLTSNNYNISYQTGKLIVTKIDVDTTGISLKQDTFTYTGEEFAVEVDNETLPRDIFNVEIKNNTAINVGNYKVQVTIEHKDTINYNPTTFELDWVIEKADADLSAVALKGNEFDYNGLTQAIEFVNIPSYAQISTVTNNQAINAGDYTVEVTFVNLDTDNYNAFEITKTFDWVINPIKLTITANDNTIYYLDEAEDADVEYYGFVNGETSDVLSGTLVFNFGEYEVGSDIYHTYIITPYGLTATNYDIEFIAGTLTVAPKQIDLGDVQWDSEQVKYTYTGEVIRPELINVPDNVDLTYKYTQATDGEPQQIAPLNVGEYNVWVQLSAVSGNYVLVNGDTERELTYTITPIEVDLASVNWVGGNAYTYSGEAVKPVLNVETLPYTTIEYSYYLSQGEQVGGVFPSAPNPTDVGYYTAWATLTLPDEINYVFTNKTFIEVFEYQIVKADIDPTKFAWKETCTKNNGNDKINDVVVREGDSYLEDNTWHVYGYTTLENDGYIHVLEIVGYEDIEEINIKYTGDNNVIGYHYLGWYITAEITLSNHGNYNDFLMIYELGYNLYDNPFATMKINGESVEFTEFANLKYLPIGTQIEFTLVDDSDEVRGSDVSCEDGVYSIEIKHINSIYFLSVYENGAMDPTVSIDLTPYILTEMYVNNERCETIYNYGHTITLNCNQDTILLDFDSEVFEKYEFYYTIHKLDDSYETFKINSLPLNITNATNIQDFTISYKNNGNDERIQTFIVNQFTPVAEYIINKAKFDGDEIESADPYIQAISVYNGIVTDFEVGMKVGYEAWIYEVFADEDLESEVNWQDLDSQDIIYIAIYDADGILFEVRKLSISYHFCSTNSTIGDNNYFELFLNEGRDQVFVFNDADGIVSVNYENTNETLVVSSTINGETELTLTQDITNGTYRIEIEYNGKTYFVEKHFTLFKAVSYESTVGNITFTDNDNNTFYIENNTLYIADIELLEENLQNLDFGYIYEGYEVINTEIITFEGETYLKVTLNYTEPNQDSGDIEGGESGDNSEGDGTESGDSENGENGDNSGSGDVVIGGDTGFGNITFQSAYNAKTGTAKQLYCYIRVCVNEEFNTNTNAIIKVYNYENNQENWITSNEYPIVIANKYSTAIEIEVENHYAKVIVTDAKGNPVNSMMDSYYYMFDNDGIYTISIKALKGEAVIYTIHVGDITGGGDVDPDDPQGDSVILFEVVVGDQQLVQRQVEGSEPYGDFIFNNIADNNAEFSAELNQSVWNYVDGDYLTIRSFVSPYLEYGAIITDCNGNVINNLNNHKLLIQIDKDEKYYVCFDVTLNAMGQTASAKFYLYLPEQVEVVELFRVVVGEQTLIQQQVENSAPYGDFEFAQNGDMAEFSVELNQSVWNYVDGDYLTITSLNSIYLQYGAVITDCNGNVIDNLNNHKLLIQTDKDEKSYVYFAVTITNNNQVMGAEFYIYLPEQSTDEVLFVLTVGNQVLTQYQPEEGAPYGDFQLVQSDLEVFFVGRLNQSAWDYVSEGYLMVSSFIAPNLEEGLTVIVKDSFDNEINNLTNFRLALSGDSTSCGTRMSITLTDGSASMTAIILLELTPQSSGEGDDDDYVEDNSGYYDEYVDISVEGMYGTSMDFEVNEGVINLTDWSILYCLEVASRGPDVYVQLVDSKNNELTGDPQRGAIYCFQEAGTYTLNVYDSEGEIIELFTINVSGNFDKTVVTIEFDGTILQETCDERWEPIGDFTYTMNMEDMERYIVNFKGYLGTEALGNAVVSMKGGPIITIDSIDSIFADRLYYDISGLNQITDLQNVDLEGRQDAYGNYYVSFYIINRWNLGDGYTMDAIMNISLYLCSRAEYVASLEYPLTIGVGTNNLKFRAKADDIGEYGDFDFDSYYGGIPYIELERSSLNLVADTETSVGGDASEMPTLEYANVTLTWARAYQDYSYCVLDMEAYGLLMSGECTFAELISQGLIYRCTDLTNNTATVPMMFMDGMAFLMVGLDGFTGENVSEDDLMIVLFLIKGEATLEDFNNMMEDDSMDGGVEMAIPDIQITVGTQILSTTNGDFMIDYNYSELFGWLNLNYSDLVQKGDKGDYIIVDNIIISAECELSDGYGKSLNFADAQVVVFNYDQYGLCAEIRVYLSSGYSFRILLAFADSTPSSFGNSVEIGK